METQNLTSEKTGAQWRRWDLHVHTPCSIQQEYGGDTPEVWELFLKDLEKLPNDTVIGVNDYVFLDGYKKLREFKANGRLKNIARLLPVVELRLDRFGGTEGKISRVNLHVIFSDSVEAETIEAQFINALSASYQLSPEYTGSIRWQGVPTRRSIADLGDKIKQVLPTNSPLHNTNSLELGFSNLNISIEKVRETLRGDYFIGKSLTAVGKTEWYDIKWTEASIAEKKTIINSVDMVFTAAKTMEDWRKSKKQLEDAGVNALLLDCSDAHNFSGASSGTHLKIGNSLTWIKSDPSFEGLRHAVCQEYETRVFVGERPSQLITVANNPTKFISSLKLTKNAGSQLAEDWFDHEIVPLNPGLVAIIGNKGSGKSALADVLGLLGNCYLDKKHFGFLNRSHFLDPKQNKGANFTAEIEWQSQLSYSRPLTAECDKSQSETIKYIPQSYLEELCNHSAENPKGSALEVELKDVILSHITKEDRLGCDTLDDLIEEHTKGNQNEIEGLRSSIVTINREICLIEDQLKPAHKTKLTNDLATKKAELAQHDSHKPKEVINPDENKTADVAQDKIIKNISKWKIIFDKNNELIELSSKSLTKLQSDQVIAKNSLQTLVQAHDRFSSQVSSLSSDFEKIGVKISEIVTLNVDLTKIVEKQSTMKSSAELLQHLLDPFSGKLYLRSERIENRILSLQDKLAGPSKEFQNYLIDLKKWEQVRTEILGDADKPGSLTHLEVLIKQIDDAPVKLDLIKKERGRITSLIATRFFDVLTLYRTLYKPVQDFIEKKILQNDQYQLSFEARIQCENFTDLFLHYINHAKAGTFYGVEDAHKRVNNLIEKNDFQTATGVQSFLDEIVKMLEFNCRSDVATPNEIDGQLAKGIKRADIYNFIFGLDYLKPRFSLKMGNRPLEQLSPGEKGLLLLAFYLLLDKDCRPLVIDQPEENLDNQTVHQLLVPCVKEARNRRQVILVTHNPNVAVVCDADQVVIASMQKRGNYKVTYDSGSIENTLINSKIVDILEGTMKAFRNRDFKYHKKM